MLARTIVSLLLPILLVALLSGCIERKEHITIKPDGSVRMIIEHETDSFDEMYLGDAWPRLDGGWLADNWTEIDDNGKETFHLKAEMTFPWGFELPSHYEIDADPFPGTATRFPTTLTIEERRDGTYYHFRRTYTARPWAPIAKLREEVEERLGLRDEPPDDDEAKQREFGQEMLAPVGDDSIKQELARQRATIEALAEYEVIKIRTFARSALDDVAPDAPQDVWLTVHAALARQTGQLDYDRLLELVVGVDDPVNEEALQAEAEAFDARARDAINVALRESGWISASKINEFFRRLDWHRTYFEITEELADDAFSIEVTMPGEIVGHNGEASGSTVIWNVAGDWFRDREYEIMVTSRVR